jgi:ATP-dependent helicase HrpB
MEQAADVVERIVNEREPGDILVFMAGMGEINATINALRAARLNEQVEFIPLHGDLPPEDQDRAFATSPRRKVVVSTNVAETSVTIDGIRHVVDSGEARVARYDAERGIGTLFVEDISRASAEQRKGRAGRTSPGACHRLWTENSQLNRPERNTPEIQRSDLAEVVLLLHSLGIRHAAEFDWLDKPDPQAVQRAERLLETLGALTSTESREAPAVSSGQTKGSLATPGGARGVVSDLTPVGRQMLRLPMHPRYSRMLIEAARRNCIPAAALCAALVSGRDLLMRLGRDDKHIAEARELFEASQDSDFFTLMRAYQFARNSSFSVESCRRRGVHAQTARQVEQTYHQLLDISRKHRLIPDSDRGEPGSDTDSSPERAESSAAGDSKDDAILRCLTAGFIDQLCVRRNFGAHECDLTEGRQGTLMRESVVQNSKLFVAATIREVTGRGSENLTLLGLATAVKREWIEEMFPDQVAVRVEHLYDRTHRRVAAVRLVRFHDLVIDHEHQREVDPVAAGRCLAEAFRKGLFELPLFNHEIKQFISRVNLVCAAAPELEFPEFDDAAVIERLTRAFSGLTLVREAQGIHLRDAITSHLAPEQAGWLDELAPTSIAWPDGRRMKLLFAETARDEDGELNAPELQIKLHECFGLREHPAIIERKLPVKLWLCAPDGKRLEATFNWSAFKANTYPKLKPALQKKYPGVGWL